ncbi:hypothetical protein SOVF_146000 [Spinacia oleracea]|nr:hypothetical protein SOVF_146000 [Spinacia oleracea]
MQSQKVAQDSNEYVSGVEGELNHSSEENTDEMRTRSVNLRVERRQVMHLNKKEKTSLGTDDRSCR